jgi:hypothetical protein
MPSCRDQAAGRTSGHLVLLLLPPRLAAAPAQLGQQRVAVVLQHVAAQEHQQALQQGTAMLCKAAANSRYCLRMQQTQASRFQQGL